MSSCCQATSHYQSQCRPRSILPHGVTRPQWVNRGRFTKSHIGTPAHPLSFLQAFDEPETLRLLGYHFANVIFKVIFLYENFLLISIQTSLKFILKCPINNKPSLVRTLAWHWSTVWYKTKFGSQNFGYQLWCLFCNICNVFKNMFNVPLIIM